MSNSLTFEMPDRPELGPSYVYTMGQYGDLQFFEAYKVLIQIFQSYLTGHSQAEGLCEFAAGNCAPYPGGTRERRGLFELVWRLRIEMYHANVTGEWKGPKCAYVSRTAGRSPERLEFAKAAVDFMQKRITEISSGG